MKRPGLLPTSAAFWRNMGLILFIVLVFIIFFGVYWLKYIPGNSDELSDRGFRTLRQLSSNIVNKYDGLQKDLVNIYGDSIDCYQMDSSLRAPFLRYVIDKIGYDTIRCTDSVPSDLTTGSVKFPVTKCNEVYHFIFNTKKHGDIYLSMDRYLKNILATRTDLFESYLVLLRPRETERAYRSTFKMSDSAAARSNFEIIYENPVLSGSDRLNLDSSLHLGKNSDLTSIITATISGRNYRLFIQPFRMHNAQLALVGLLGDQEYAKETKSMPVGFASALIIIMILLLTILPLVKIFFVGPKERIMAKDVLTMNLAIYIGTSFLVLILLYFCIAFVTARAFNTHLQEISGRIAGEFNSGLRRAGDQLARYDTLFQKPGSPSDSFFRTLQNKHPDAASMTKADSLFLPVSYSNFSRVFWMGQQGSTLIKWNPYTIHVPLSPLAGYPHFDSLLKMTPENTSPDQLLVSAGKSNVTDEFQVYVSRLSRAILAPSCNDTSPRAHAITMASFPDCSNFPILPPGFSFSIIDNASFNVLINSDPRRNLSENILDETMENERLRYAVQYKVHGPIDPVNIYGTDHVFLVTPLQGARMSLLVYYDKGIIFHNIFRLVHFTAESLLYLFCALILCVLATTGFSNRPGKLRFNLKQVVWVRPSIRNLKSYRFTGAYWALLFVFTALFSIGLLLAADYEMLFYIVLLLPLYTIWGFVSSRKKAATLRLDPDREGGDFLPDITRSGNAILFFVLMFNYVFWNLTGKEAGNNQLSHHLLILLYQAGALLLFYYFYRDDFFKDQHPDAPVSKLLTRLHITPVHTCDDYFRMYHTSLCWSVLLISILPVIGIMAYGYQSEKIQYLKGKQLHLAVAWENRVARISDAITDDYKPALRQNPAFARFIDSLKYRNSQYLFAQDTIHPPQDDPLVLPRTNLPDGPYSFLLDSLFLVTPTEYATFSLRDQAADESWRFLLADNNQLYLDYRQTGGSPVTGSLMVSTTVDSLLDFEPRRAFWVMLLAAFCIFMLRQGAGLLKSVVRRIFLLDYYKTLPKMDDELLRVHLAPAIRRYKHNYSMTSDDVMQFFNEERESFKGKVKEWEEYILKITVELKPTYEKIWDSLDPEEKFFLYDFALDGFANYKDAETLTRLTQKRLLLYENSHFRLFSLSFRNFLLAKRGTSEVDRLKDKYAAPGIWETMRVPTLVLIAVAGIFIFTTQDDLAHKLSAVLTSIGALIPLLLKMTGKNASEG